MVRLPEKLLTHLRRLRAAYLVLCLAVVPVPFLYLRLEHYTAELRQGQFQGAMEAVRGRMESQFTYYIALLAGMRGFLSAQEVATPDEFRRYLDGLDLRHPQPAGTRQVPGLVDLGFAARVRAREMESHTRTMRDAGYHAYTPRFAGPGPDYFPVVYLDSLGPEGMVPSGWDAFADPVRRAAMEKARDTGEAVATDPTEVFTIDPRNRTRGFILYLPVYAGGVTPTNQERRRDLLSGFVFASFEAASFWRSVEHWDTNVLDLLVFDGPKFTPEHRIYPAPDAPAPYHPASLIDGFNADGLGRTWGFFFASNIAFDSRIERRLPLLVLLGGLVLSFGLFRVAVALVHARDRAAEQAEARRESEARFRGIFEAIPDLFFRVDLDGVLQLISPSCRTILGYEPSEVVGQSAATNFTRPSDFEVIRQRVRALGRADDVEVSLRRKDGQEVPFSLTVQLRRGSHDQPCGFEGILRDISARKHAEAERLRTSKLESLGLLAGGIAHDFNNILAAILSNVGIARLAHSASPDLDETLSEIDAAVVRARELTQQLLTFAKGGAPIRKACRLAPLIRDSVRFATRGSSVLAEFDLAPELWPVEIDAGQINQVLHNVTLNAVQVMPQGGHLTVKAANVRLPEDAAAGLKPGPYVEVSLGDRGPGIFPEDLARVFDPYFTTKAQGSGLGLTTCYSIVQRHEGRIVVESAPGSGTTVRFWLPASPDAVVPDPSSTTQAPLPTGSGRVLIVDDEKTIRDSLARMLERLGYRALAVPDGEAAIEALRQATERDEPFAAAILDLTIPGGLGGRDALPRLRAIQPGLPAIVSSGYSNDPVMADYRAFGFDGLLAKPYPLESLASTLRRVIRSRGS